MRRAALFSIAAFALWFVAATAARAQPAPDSAMLQPVHRWIDAYNAGTPLPEDVFAPDVVITDEFPPYVWAGEAGEHAWAQAIDSFIKPGNQHVSVGKAQSFQSLRDGTRVRFVLPATLSYTSSRSGKQETEQALWLFVLTKSADAWKIAADTWTTASTPTASISSPMQIEHGVLLLPATVNGAGPFLFTFDPGAGDLYTRNLRERLNGRPPQTMCVSSACFPMTMEYFDGDPLQLFPRHDASIGVLGGSIGPALLQRYVVQIDYRASTLTLIPPDQFVPPHNASLTVLGFDANQMPTIPAAVDGKTAVFELDVRAPTSMLFTPFLERSGLRGTYSAAPAALKSGELVAHAVHSVSVAGAELHDAAFWFSTASSGKFAASDVAGLLGNNVLSHFVITLDVPRRRAYLVFDPTAKGA